MQGQVVEGSTVVAVSLNAVAMPEWLEQKLLEEIRAAYAYGVKQAARSKEDGLKALENGLRERMLCVGGKLFTAAA